MNAETTSELGHGTDVTRGYAAEIWVVALVLVAMAVFTFLEVLGRSAIGAGVPGGLLYTQHLTLWVGFLGALLASATGGHLSLATGSFLTGEKIKAFAKFYSATFSSVVCALLAAASARMVSADMKHSGVLPGGLPEWWSELVMPFALILMALRFSYRAGDKWPHRIAAFVITGLAFLLVYAEPVASKLIWPGAILILVGVILGAPVFVAMAAIAMLLFFAAGTTIAAVPTETFRLVASPSLPAIPLLTATGYVLAEGGASKRFLRLARAWFGWLPGGMALMVCLVCALFTTFTGGSGVTLLALGGLVMPMLLTEKYPQGFSLGLVTTSGSLGLLFPPSLPVILYAVVAGASISELYFAGLVPGIIMILLIAGYAVVQGIRANTPRHKFDLQEALRSTWETKWELAIPLLVVVSMLTALATPVEASGLALIAAIIVETFMFRDMHPVRDLPKTLARAGTLTGAVLILLGVAMGLTSYLVDEEVPRAVVDWTTTHIRSPWLFLLVLNVVLLIVGSIVEIYAAIVVLAPLIAPMAAAYQIDPLHLGIVFLANLELGFLLPPMGLNLILASSRFGESLFRLYRVILPFFFILLAGLLLVTYVPAMTVGVARKLTPEKAKQEQPEKVLTPDAESPGGPVSPENFDWDAE